jgi:hypothetical protein
MNSWARAKTETNGGSASWPFVPTGEVICIYFWASQKNISVVLCDILCKYLCWTIMFFSRSNDTVLGEASDDQEVFMLDDCEDIKYDVVMYKIKVIYYIDRCDLLRFLDDIHYTLKHRCVCKNSSGYSESCGKNNKWKYVNYRNLFHREISVNHTYLYNKLP